MRVTSVALRGSFDESPWFLLGFTLTIPFPGKYGGKLFLKTRRERLPRGGGLDTFEVQ